MICKTCGSEFDNSLAACPVCSTPSGAAPQAPQQPAYQQPVQPNYQPVYQQPVQPNYQPPVQPNYQQPNYQQGYAQAGVPNFGPSAVDQYIQEASSINTMSVAGVILAFLCGLIGLILSLVSGSKIKNLPYIQPETLDPTKAFAYQEAQKKVNTAKTLNTVAIVVFVINIIIGFISGFISGFVGAL